MSGFSIYNKRYAILISEVDEVGTGATDELEEEPSASQMAGKNPNFCVLLHGSLKVEGMVALVQLGWDIYKHISILLWSEMSAFKY